MTGNVPDDRRLDWYMNQRRLDLGLRWEDIADAIGISESGLRTLRREGTTPRDLTQRAIERALSWDRGSVARILAGGKPGLAEDPGDPVDLTPQCEYEREALATPGLDEASKRLLVRVHRKRGHSARCSPDGPAVTAEVESGAAVSC